MSALERYKNDPIFRQKHLDTNKRIYQERKEQRLAKATETRRSKRRVVIQHYGGKCACCGEIVLEFLAIDHISGGGNKHRKSLGNGNGHHFYTWIIKNNFPEGLRVLCHNCNLAIGFYGRCPHNGV